VSAAAVIGLDLDNTLVSYDDLFHALALERGLIDDATPKHKRMIRDAIRRSDDGEQHWRRLQALAYGGRMSEAALIEGVAEFIRECGQRGLAVHIISHRTLNAVADPDGTDLRAAAIGWMRSQGFFDARGLGLDPSRVWFEATRADKVARIRQVACSYFVDDLEEVFLEPAFPDHVVKILYAPDAERTMRTADVRVAATWAAVREVVFGH
jgi:hypothetical protein